jgi:glycosyltransferase involved in cell wall biosynthesis
MASSHWMILPSVGEAFGIAPAEAAHFGLPSIVSDIGGLPTVIRHNKTGIVMDIKASASDYCDQLERISKYPDEYELMCNNALQHAHKYLSWEVWARKIQALCFEIAGDAN